MLLIACWAYLIMPVSYTHLDVYKRQGRLQDNNLHESLGECEVLCIQDLIVLMFFRYFLLLQLYNQILLQLMNQVFLYIPILYHKYYQQRYDLDD